MRMSLNKELTIAQTKKRTKSITVMVKEHSIKAMIESVPYIGFDSKIGFIQNWYLIAEGGPIGHRGSKKGMRIYLAWLVKQDKRIIDMVVSR